LGLAQFRTFGATSGESDRADSLAGVRGQRNDEPRTKGQWLPAAALLLSLSPLSMLCACRNGADPGPPDSEQGAGAEAVVGPTDELGGLRHNRELAAALEGHVRALATEIGGRGLDRPGTMAASATYLREQWRAQGYRPLAQSYAVPEAPPNADGTPAVVDNLWVTIPGRSPAVVVIGAHYDTCQGNPGADDNASGVAALLELTRALATAPQPDKTLHFVAFANEEPPYFKRPARMGSSVYASMLADRNTEVVAMLSLESIGYYSDAPDSQHYPKIIAALYPSTGNFVAVVGKNRSRPLIRRLVRTMEAAGPVPVESIAAPATITGIDWSDHWSFWEQGWSQAVMITDTATYRNPHYHEMSDTPETLDYGRLAAVTVAIEAGVRELAWTTPD